MSDASFDKAALEAARPTGLDALDLVENAAGALMGEAEKVVGGPLYPISFYAEIVDERLMRGAWPGSKELLALAGEGVQVVINLCAERRQDAEVAAAGLLPRNIALTDGEAPWAGALEVFLGAVDAARKIFVHCELGKGRTGCMVAGYRVRRCGWTPARALDEAEHFGTILPCQRAWILALS